MPKDKMKNYNQYFRSHALHMFYSTRGVAKDLGDATILFAKPFTDGKITFNKVFNNSFVDVGGVLSEEKLIGYVLTIPAYYSFRSIGASLFVASSVENVELPSDIDSPFTGKNFSVFVDDKEQAVACIGNVPVMVDVSKG